MHHCGTATAYGAQMAPPCSFTFLFDVPTTNKTACDVDEAFADPYTYYSSSSSSCSSPVDCTLSLGTASTRRSRSSPQRNATTTVDSSSSSCMPTFYWDILSQTKTTATATAASTRGGNGISSGSLSSGSDPLLARRCANCDTTSTPLWRNGPRGPKSLCNACGIRYKKEERRAAATLPPMEPQKHHHQNQQQHQQQNLMGYGGAYQHEGHPWGYAATAPSQPNAGRSPSVSLSSSSGDHSRRWTGADDYISEDAGAALPYLSWCLNVPSHAEYLHH